jgi:hypothetical protein
MVLRELSDAEVRPIYSRNSQLTIVSIAIAQLFSSAEGNPPNHLVFDQRTILTSLIVTEFAHGKFRSNFPQISPADFLAPFADDVLQVTTRRETTAISTTCEDAYEHNHFSIDDTDRLPKSSL